MKNESCCLSALIRWFAPPLRLRSDPAPSRLITTRPSLYLELITAPGFIIRWQPHPMGCSADPSQQGGQKVPDQLQLQSLIFFHPVGLDPGKNNLRCSETVCWLKSFQSLVRLVKNCRRFQQVNRDVVTLWSDLQSSHIWKWSSDCINKRKGWLQ